MNSNNLQLFEKKTLNKNYIYINQRIGLCNVNILHDNSSKVSSDITRQKN